MREKGIKISDLAELEYWNSHQACRQMLINTDLEKQYRRLKDIANVLGEKKVENLF